MPQAGPCTYWHGLLSYQQHFNRSCPRWTIICHRYVMFLENALRWTAGSTQSRSPLHRFSFSPSENNVLGNDHSCSHAYLKPLAVCYAAGEKWKPTSLVTRNLKSYTCYVQHFVILAVKNYKNFFMDCHWRLNLAWSKSIETYNILSHHMLHISVVEFHNLYIITSMSSLPQLDTFLNVDTVLSSHWLARYSSLWTSVCCLQWDHECRHPFLQESCGGC